MIVSDDFNRSPFARDAEFTTNSRITLSFLSLCYIYVFIEDKSLVIQFAANNGKALADAAEKVAKYVW